ncbi:MAG: hypothetical protein L3J44_09425 [Campylobacteraceae bacterium]|nr:hypothetical protein [Campylobacteraceae bacterium]
MNKNVVFTTILGAIFIAGCAGTTPSLGKVGKSGNYESSLKSGNFKKLSENLKKNQKDDLLWYLDAGVITRYAKDYNASDFFFDKSEDKIKQYDKEVLAGKILANVGAVVTNDTFMDYRPRIYEGIMVNTYKGMNFLSQNDFANARVEFNRALERQRRAKEFFAKEISQEKKKIEKENAEKIKKKKLNPNQIQKASNNRKTKDAIEKKYSNLFAFKPYPDFINPFTSYMSGLFFISAHDYSKAADILKETYGMIKGNESGASYVKRDLKYALKMASSLGRKQKRHYAWIVFLNGVGPSKKELRFDIPLFLVTRGLYYTGIALPTFKENPQAFSTLIVKNGKANVRTKEVASMDKIVKIEFKKRFPLVMTRAITRTVAQSILQYQLKKQGGLIGGLLGAAYQGFMNRADTRQWNQLPKDFQIARVRLNSPMLSIGIPGGKNLLSLKLNPSANHIIFVRIPKSTSKVIYNEVSF